MNQTNLLVETIVKGLQEKKGHGIVTVDLKKIPEAICQYLVICEGKNPHQVSSLSDSVWETVNRNLKENPSSVHGLCNAQWVGMDYGTVIVHIFLPETRSFYRLENLWEDSKIMKIPDID
ncbi:MAG: ribosome silencing factor [Tannerella sp.]|jgi:ribosome-associated protein|nr:ribosome silencing factor [Tannerella sp.]